MINELHRCESGGKKKKNPIPFHSSCSVSARSPTVYTKQLQFLGYSMLKCAEFHKNKINKPKKKKTSLFSNFVIDVKDFCLAHCRSSMKVSCYQHKPWRLLLLGGLSLSLD